MKHMKGVEPTATEAQPKKRHPLFDRPIIAQLVYVVLDLALTTLIFTVSYQAISTLDGPASQLADSAAAVTAAILMTLFYQFHFRDEFDGMFEWSSYGMLLTLPVYAFVFTNIFDVNTMQFAFLDPNNKMNSLPVCFGIALAPGIFEELLFRGIPISNWMRVAKDSDDIMKCAVITSVIFGFAHTINALHGAAISSTIYQIFYCLCLGMFFAAVFLRTASIWPTMIIHTLLDFTSLLFLDLENGGVMAQELTFGLDFYVTLGINIALLLMALFLLRKSKREQIMQLWDRKWHKTAIVEQDRFMY